MKRDKWLYIILGVLFVLYAATEHFAPEPLSWEYTFGQTDKNPYGICVMYERFDDFFKAKSTVYFPVSEQKEPRESIIALSNEMSLDEYDLKALLSYVEEGGNVLLAATLYNSLVLDSLDLQTELDPNFNQIFGKDSVNIFWENHSSAYPANMFGAYFELPDSSDWRILAKTDHPVIVGKTLGKGQLILATCPLIFTNYALLRQDGYRLVEWLMNELPEGNIIYNRYYHVGRMESDSVFRFFMRHTALRWAVYLTLFGLFLILFVTSRRKQQAIPVLEPKENTTVQYIRTIGGLYFREMKHQRAAEKLIIHFLRVLKEQYYVTDFYNENTYALLAAKSGLAKDEVIQTMEFIQRIKSGGRVTEEMLLQLSARLTKFKLK